MDRAINCGVKVVYDQPKINDSLLVDAFIEVEGVGLKTFDTLNNAVTGWASNFSRNLLDIAKDSEVSFRSILSGFVDMLAQMTIQLLVVEPLIRGVLGIVGGFKIGSQVAALNLPIANVPLTPSFTAPGFAEGGLVPGPVGAPMAAIVHGGEEVRTPAQQKGGGDGVTQIFNISPGLPETVRAEITRFMPQIRQAAIDAVTQDRRRGGGMAVAMGSRA